MHTIVRHLLCALRLLREFFFGAHSKESFVGSTLMDSQFPPTKVVLPWPRGRDRR